MSASAPYETKLDTCRYTNAALLEAAFYSEYAWCLNPVLSVAELRQRLQEELDRFETLVVNWQREESRINLYLFVCAIACTIDDYLAAPSLNLSPFAALIPRLQPLFTALQSCIDRMTGFVKGVRDWRVRRWRRGWNACVSQACRMLALEASGSSQRTEDRLTEAIRGLLTRALPRRVEKRRMRLPEAFRCQDLAHQDAIALAERYCDTVPGDAQPTAIVGLRTAGAYLAPLVAACLESRGVHPRWCITIRPKMGVSLWEKRKLTAIQKQNARVLVIDDYPSSGHTLKLTIDLLGQFKIDPRNITILAPAHPGALNWPKTTGLEKLVRIVTLGFQELYKARLLQPEHFETLYSEYLPAHESGDGGMTEVRNAAFLNARLAEHYPDGLHVRIKRVFDVTEKDGSCKRIFAKSAGWGWLGYHAYLAGDRLSGFVPKTLGLRHGLLLTEWIEHDAANQAEPGPQIVGAYVATRTRRLSLFGETWLDSRTYRWTGHDQIVDIIRALYGPLVGRLRGGFLRRQLSKCASPVPALLDGRIGPGEWIRSAESVYKLDFEHHNFGGGEVDMTDSAYDLAAAICEFGLDRESEREMLETYADASGDPSITQRVLLYKLFYGIRAMDHAADAVGLCERKMLGYEKADEWNQRHHRLRDFLADSLRRFCGAMLAARSNREPVWSDSLLFMGVEGILDRELLGFPHTTANGIQALAALKESGLSLVLNTERGVDQVWEYCRSYGLPGGVAECGAVFLDNVSKREIRLFDAAVMEQLATLRESVCKLPGVFVDPGYRYAVRAYRYINRRMQALSHAEAQGVLRASHCDALRVWSSSDAVIFTPKDTSKAKAVQQVGEYFQRTTATAGIGNSDMDAEMLACVDSAYAPANCASSIRDLAQRGRCRIMKHSFQTGLLESVRHIIGAHIRVQPVLKPCATAENPDALLRTLLAAADRPTWHQVIALLRGRL
jgi:hydroxymethylpyrimidine pyrophosphatase-like HAD family hydrolase/adenine/guanine phosphoribosyltransferase-like PRPP-binding protein